MVVVIAVLLALALSPAFGAPASQVKAIGEGSAAVQDPPFVVSDAGLGSIAVVFIAGGQVPGPCLDAAAAAVGARYRIIRFRLDEETVAACGGPSGTAAALAKVLAKAGVERACIVGCCSAAGIIGEAAVTMPSIQGAVLFGEPKLAELLPVPVVYVASSVQAQEVVSRVYGFLGGRDGEVRTLGPHGPSLMMTSAAYPL